MQSDTHSNIEALKAQLNAHKLAQYLRVSGGLPIPMAGAVYWLILAWLGTQTDLNGWATIAFPLSGAIFPLALFFAFLTKNDFMKDKSAISSVLFPTFASMLLFWPMLFMAAKSAAPELVVPILAIGMSLHWPVIGWAYNRTALFTAHSIARAAAVLFVWFSAPETMLVWIPVVVAASYIFTVVAIYFDLKILRHKSNLTLNGASA
ncbi:MAG: hypothetical protein ABJO36_03720 [Litorimonas sp.]